MFGKILIIIYNSNSILTHAYTLDAISCIPRYPYVAIDCCIIIHFKHQITIF